MADEAAAADEDGGGDGGPPPKCPECVPGLPAWMGTFSDLVTLLLTFFVLLLSMAKTETSKYQAALGSIRSAFGGNVLQAGKVLQLGKSPDNAPTMLDSQEPIKPFPIEFLTSEGFLDKHEINRESTEDLKSMKEELLEVALSDNVDIYEMPEGIKVRVKDKIYFNKGSVQIADISIEVFQKLIKLVAKGNWTIFVEGHAAKGERGSKGQDVWRLSSERAMAVARTLIKMGISPGKVTAVFYGDTRPDESFANSRDSNMGMNRRVEFVVRKTDLRTKGNRVESK